MNFEEIYETSAECTGKTVEQLKQMAELVFATMLYHAMMSPGSPTWTVIVVGPKRLEVEVNFTPRNIRPLSVSHEVIN